MAQQDQQLTLREAADISGLSPVSLKQAARDGRLTATRIGEGRRSLFVTTRADLEDYLANRKTWKGYTGKRATQHEEGETQ